MNKFFLILIFIIMTVLGAFAGYFLKLASTSKGIKVLIKTPTFYLGGVLYLFSAVINVYLLKFIDFSLMLPLTAVTYIWTMIIAKRLLNESITKKKLVGTLFIISGVLTLTICI